MVQLQLAFIERWLHYRGRLQWLCAMFMLFGARKAGCFREVAALYSDPLRQIPLCYVFGKCPVILCCQRTQAANHLHWCSPVCKASPSMRVSLLPWLVVIGVSDGYVVKCILENLHPLLIPTIKQRQKVHYLQV